MNKNEKYERESENEGVWVSITSNGLIVVVGK
jgi:hypothetical protein